MLYINFSNIETLLLENSELYYVLPSELRPYIEQWKIGKQFPMLRQIGKSAIYDLVNALDDNAIEPLEAYFGERVIVEKLNYNIVENVKVPIEDSNEVCEELCETRGFNYFSTWRDEKYLYITFWR